MNLLILKIHNVCEHGRRRMKIQRPENVITIPENHAGPYKFILYLINRFSIQSSLLLLSTLQSLVVNDRWSKQFFIQ